MYTVLVVDDDKQIGGLIEAICRPLEVHIAAAYNGEEGLSMAKDLHPDVILVDLLMPGAFDGWETIRQIQSEPQLQAIPIIVLTATGAAHDQTAAEVQYVAYFRKPFAPKELRDCIREHLPSV